jgi:hypothetical protein
MKYLPPPRTSRWTVVSQILGGILLGIGIFWLAKIFFFSAPATAPSLPMAGVNATPTSLSQKGTVSTPASLRAAGITLSGVQGSTPIDEAQALQLARQDEPDATSSAKKLVATAVTLDYPAAAAARGQQDIRHLMAWMIWCQQVPQGGEGIAVDKQPNHDLYIFLDAKTGQEVLTIWL